MLYILSSIRINIFIYMVCYNQFRLYSQIRYCYCFGINTAVLIDIYFGFYCFTIRQIHGNPAMPIEKATLFASIDY
jgi:hypothetical protein